MRRQYAILPVLLLFAACVSSGGNVLNAYTRQLESSIVVYEETMIAAGAAAEQGLISEDQLEKIAHAGRIAQSSLEAARSTLSAYAASGEGDPWLFVEQAQLALMALTRAAVEAGVTR